MSQRHESPFTMSPESFRQLFSTASQAATDTGTLRETFSNIYANDLWGGGSGPGSRPENLRAYIAMLQSFLRDNHVRSVVDCGCGDWQFSRHLDFGPATYLGFDIVPSVVEANRRSFASPSVEFRCEDFTAVELPPADLLICKDVLQHLRDANVERFLRQLAKFKFVLLTNDAGSNVGRDANLQVGPYHFARIDVLAPPFSLPGRVVCEMPGGKCTVLVEPQQVSAVVSASQDLTLATTMLRTEELERAASSEAALPNVLLAILAKQKEAVLPFYLRCIEALDYPKSKIHLYIRSNNNTDETESLLRSWVERVGGQYASVEADYRDVSEQVQQFAVHEWNPLRFKVLAFIRQQSLLRTLSRNCDFYFTADVDNFLRPGTLRALVRVNLPIIGPLLRHEDSNNPYSNYHHEVDANGYFANSDEYYWLLNRRIRGISEVKVIHCTYLVKADVIPKLMYDDGSGRYEYVVFSASARAAGISQYLDTREVYGYLTLTETPDRSRQLIDTEVSAAIAEQTGRHAVDSVPHVK